MNNREIAERITKILSNAIVRDFLTDQIEFALDAKDKKPIDGEGWAEAAFDVMPIVPGSIRYLNDPLAAAQAAQYSGLGLGCRPFSGFK